MEAFPHEESPFMTLNYGPLALQHILSNGGSAYLPERMVITMLDDGSLYTVEELPSFDRHIYATYLKKFDDPRFETALQGLKYVATVTEDQLPT